MNHQYSEHEKSLLLETARSSIENGIRNNRPHQPDLDACPDNLRDYRATFVTLNKQKQLRGCIGVLEARQPLIQDTAINAYSAAFRDARFAPLGANELDQIRISISVLTPSWSLDFTDQEELVDLIKPGVDGLILEDGRHRGVFLPSVWQQLPDPESFLGQLKRKAGLTPDYWSENLRVSAFHTLYFSEPG